MGAIKTENFSSVEITTEHDLWVWLSNNFGSKDSVWLITYKKSTPQKYLSREQVLDALIAYGWIDGIRRKLDDQRTMQLISQRKTQSWSATYKQRAERLEAEGRMQKSGRNAISQSKLLGLWDAVQDVDTLVIPNDLQILLDKDRTAATYFTDCPPSYKRNVLRWLKSAKTERTRQKRLHSIFTECKAENRIPQM
jgi:uncharacterized protein YdeI (YjbR/CyaY-like superfamily)